MNIYRFRAFLEEIPWLQNILDDYMFMAGEVSRANNLSITIRSIDAGFLSLDFVGALCSTEFDVDKEGKSAAISTDTIRSFWIVEGKKEDKLLAHKIIDFLKMGKNKTDLGIFQRPLSELFDHYKNSPYFIWVFTGPKDMEYLPIDIVILKPKAEENFLNYFSEIQNKIRQEVKKELGS